MQCKIADLRCKEVINIHTGMRMGFVSDILVNTVTGQVVSLIIPGPCKFFGLFCRESDFVVPWECIRRIGDDIILIEVTGDFKRDKKSNKSLI